MGYFGVTPSFEHHYSVSGWVGVGGIDLSYKHTSNGKPVNHSLRIDLFKGVANMDGGDTKSEMMENAALCSSGSSGSGSGSANALAAAASV